MECKEVAEAREVLYNRVILVQPILPPVLVDHAWKRGHDHGWKLMDHVRILDDKVRRLNSFGLEAWKVVRYAEFIESSFKMANN